jgi:hypothetical protein
MATIDLASKFLPYVDEEFSTTSKKSLITNKDFDWTGAKSVLVYKVTTSEMNDYDRSGNSGNASRYGTVASLNATTDEYLLKKDRSFTFAIDKLDEDETQQQLTAATALARQIRQVVIPEVDSYTYGVMAANAGTIPEPTQLTAENIYAEILAANQVMDDEMVPETDRYILVTPATYLLMKRNPEIVMETDIGAELRQKGVISMVDGASVIKVPSSRLPDSFGFMIVHPSATVAPIKLQDYKTHQEPLGISGTVVEGRINYDAFVLANKKKAIYYQRTI